MLVIAPLSISAVTLGCGNAKIANLSSATSACSAERRVEALASNAAILVGQKHAADRSGHFVSYDSAAFTYYDFTDATNVTLGYEDVKNIQATSSNALTTAQHHHTVWKHVIF